MELLHVRFLSAAEHIAVPLLDTSQYCSANSPDEDVLLLARSKSVLNVNDGKEKRQLHYVCCEIVIADLF